MFMLTVMLMLTSKIMERRGKDNKHSLNHVSSGVKAPQDRTYMLMLMYMLTLWSQTEPVTAL